MVSVVCMREEGEWRMREGMWIVCIEEITSFFTIFYLNLCIQQCYCPDLDVIRFRSDSSLT